MTVSPEEFRQIAGSFSTGVTIVTTVYEGQPAGLTANAFTSVSLDPLLVLVCVEKQVHSHDAIDLSGIFAVNILTQEMRSVSDLFARRGATPQERFEAVVHTTSVTGAPILTGTLGWFDCHVTHRYSGGDHTIFVGKVVAAAKGDGQPLIFFQSHYAKLLS